MKADGVMAKYLASAQVAVVKVALQKTEGNVSKAAKNVGVSRTTFYEIMKRHGIRAMDYWPPDRKVERIMETLQSIGDRMPKLF